MLCKRDMPSFGVNPSVFPPVTFVNSVKTNKRIIIIMSLTAILSNTTYKLEVVFVVNALDYMPTESRFAVVACCELTFGFVLSSCDHLHIDQLYSPKGRHNNKIKKNRKYIK